MKVGINSVAETLQMINESSFPVTDIYLTLANINFLFYQFSLNYIKNAPLLKKKRTEHKTFNFRFRFSVSPSPIGLDFGTLDFGLGLDDILLG